MADTKITKIVAREAKRQLMSSPFTESLLLLKIFFPWKGLVRGFNFASLGISGGP